MYDIPIIVNSCKPFVNESTPVLINSLLKSGVPPQYIHIVVGECEECRDYVKNDNSYHETQTVNIDFNGIQWILGRYPETVSQTNWLFYIHDTCMVTEDFWTNVQSIYEKQLKDSNYETAQLNKTSCNIGFYNYDLFKKSYVINFCNKDRNMDLEKKQTKKREAVKTEDTFFRNSNTLNLNKAYNIDDTIIHLYSSTIPRRLETYPIPGVIKVKANWLSKSKYTIEL